MIASAQLNVSITTATSSSKSHLEVRIHTFKQGTIGTADIKVEDIMATARQFPIDVSGNKAFPYAVQLQDYTGLKSPNDAFNYYDVAKQQADLEDMAKQQFGLLALRDNLRYILSHAEDFENADHTPVDRHRPVGHCNEVVAQVNALQVQAAACSRDPDKCAFTPFDASKFAVPRLAKAPSDDLAVRGKALAEQDPLALALRNAQPVGPGQRGFDLGMALAATDTLPGPTKQRTHDGLPLDQQGGFAVAVDFCLDRNRNVDYVTRGGKVLAADAAAAGTWTALPPGLGPLGFQIATGLFGTAALGALGNTMKGPGSAKIRADLAPGTRAGFDAGVAYWKPGGNF